MNTKQFRYVLTLASEGSFSRAAETLKISQPSLSQYIKKIECEIGIILFDRTNGEVRITDAGKIYIDTARQILDLEHQMENSLIDIAGNRVGSLIIGTSPYRAASMMPPIARRFQIIFPGIHLIVREGTTVELEEGMEHGDYDMALTLSPVDNHLFCYEKVLEEELLLAVPASQDQLKLSECCTGNLPTVDVAVLDGQSLVMLTETQFMQKQLLSILIEKKISIHTAAIVKSLEAQIEFVKAGVGMALVPSGIERFCNDGSVTFYSFSDPLPKREVVVMWRKNQKLSKLALKLKELIHSIDW